MGANLKKWMMSVHFCKLRIGTKACSVSVLTCVACNFLFACLCTICLRYAQGIVKMPPSFKDDLLRAHK